MWVMTSIAIDTTQHSGWTLKPPAPLMEPNPAPRAVIDRSTELFPATPPHMRPFDVRCS